MIRRFFVLFGLLLAAPLLRAADPVVTITAPTSSSTFTSYAAPITIEGTATDDGTVESITWTCDNCTLYPGASGDGIIPSTGLFRLWVTIDSGTATIVVTATDDELGTGQDSIDITLGSASTYYYYVDPTYTGGNNDGSATKPWLRLDQTAQWNVINGKLATDHVVVYISARQAGSDTDETSSYAVQVLRTDMSTHTLTICSNCKWNNNDSTPPASWPDYSGNSRYHITHNYPLTTTNSALVKVNYATVRGFRLTSTGGQIVYWWGGDHVWVKDNKGVQDNPGNGPGLQLIYARQREQDEEPCVPTSDHNCGSVNVHFEDNEISYIYGEGIYIGGVNEWQIGSQNPYPINLPGHMDVFVKNNKISYPGYWGGEGDCIDIKNAVVHVEVSGNTCVAAPQSGISSQSGGIFDGNFINDVGQSGLVFGTVWASYQTRANSIIRNNIIIKAGGGATMSWAHGIRVTATAISIPDALNDNWIGSKFYNNTIYATEQKPGGGAGSGFYVEQDYGSTLDLSMWNNIISESDSYELDLEDGGDVTTHSDNNFYDSTSTQIHIGANTWTGSEITSNWEASAELGNPSFVSPGAPYDPTGFKLESDSPNIDEGYSVVNPGYDYGGTLRPNGEWDIGAWEYVGGDPPGSEKGGGMRFR